MRRLARPGGTPHRDDPRHRPGHTWAVHQQLASRLAGTTTGAARHEPLRANPTSTRIPPPPQPPAPPLRISTQHTPPPAYPPPPISRRTPAPPRRSTPLPTPPPPTPPPNTTTPPTPPQPPTPQQTPPHPTPKPTTHKKNQTQNTHLGIRYSRHCPRYCRRPDASRITPSSCMCGRSSHVARNMAHQIGDAARPNCGRWAIGTTEQLDGRPLDGRALSANRVLQVLRSRQAFRRPYVPKSDGMQVDDVADHEPVMPGPRLQADRVVQRQSAHAHSWR